VAKPDEPEWASAVEADPTRFLNPGATPRAQGWSADQRPPNQWFNWLLNRAWRCIVYLFNKTDTIYPTLLRSAATLAWNGSTIVFTQPIQLSFRHQTTEQINQILAAASPLTLADGEVLVVRKDRYTASPVTLVAGTYGALVDGEYAIVAEASLTDVDQENESIIFRRRGTNLEIPIHGLIYSSGDIITLGQSSVNAAGYIPPIGTIQAFYDFNAALTFDTAFFAYCDGSSRVVGSLGSQTLPDLSGRYLVGFGTDGGGDIDTAVWGTAAVGNAGSTINIAHSHTESTHTHGAGSYSATAHTHPAPAITGLVNQSAPGVGYELQIGGGQNMNLNPSSPLQGDHAHDGFGNTGSGGGGAISGTSGSGGGGTTNTQLSSTQDIRPRSIRVRYIMRVA